MNSLLGSRASLGAAVVRARWIVAGAFATLALLPQASCAIQLNPPPPGAALETGGGGNLTEIDGGFVAGSWTDVTGNLLKTPAQCGTLAGMAAKPDEDLLIASISGGSLYGSSNGGKSWDVLGSQTDGG